MDAALKRNDICFYGEKCNNEQCTRQHLPEAKTPCMYGVRCTLRGCKKIHPERIFEQCKYGEHCKNNQCKYVHNTDFCKHGVVCTYDKCRYVHPIDMCPTVQKILNKNVDYSILNKIDTPGKHTTNKWDDFFEDDFFEFHQ